MTRNQISLTVAIFLSTSFPTLAQIDLSGSWASKNHEDALERGAGPNPGDFTGIPFNDAGRAKAMSYKQSQISMQQSNLATLENQVSIKEPGVRSTGTGSVYGDRSHFYPAAASGRTGRR